MIGEADLRSREAGWILIYLKGAVGGRRCDWERRNVGFVRKIGAEKKERTLEKTNQHDSSQIA